MRRIATLFLLLQLALFGLSDTKKIKKYTLYASQIESERSMVYAQGNILIYNQEMMFSAKEAVYDQQNEILLLKGDVILFYQGKMVNKAEELRFNLQKDQFSATKVFIQELGSDIWIESKKIKVDKNNFIIKHASLSSCAVNNPDWQIKFSTGHFHRDKEYVSLYNPRFYLGSVPVFYLPWIAFPTIKDRRSGLLRPVIGFENSENLLFMQPIFIAPSPSWDIELNPQIRLNRGKGVYATLRFADSAYSNGALSMGIFDEQKDYAQTHNLQNKVHKGASFYYRNEALFTKYIKKNPYDYKDGLYVDLIALNDIDYINLKDDRKYAVDKLVTSRINYYMAGYGDYIGTYAKYFIDTQKLSNADTLQTLPSLQYHKFSQILGLKQILYSIDYKFKNSYRRKGLGARQHEFSMPFVFTTPLMEHYLNFSASENFYYSRVYYTEGNESTHNATYFSNYHRFSLDTDLMKQYHNTVHNIQFSLAFTIPSFQKEKGYFADFIPFNVQRKNIALKVNNYLYNQNAQNYLIDRFSQYYYYKEEDRKYNEAENEVIYRYSENLTLRNSLIYSYEYHKLKKIQSGIYYHDDINKVRLDHTFKDAPNETKINFVSGDFSRIIDRHYTLLGGVDYDLDNTFTKEWRIGVAMRKKCWSYELRYKESITPSLTSGGTESIIKRGIYLLIRFAQIGGVTYKYVKDVESKELTSEDFENNLPDTNKVPIDEQEAEEKMLVLDTVK